MKNATYVRNQFKMQPNTKPIRIQQKSSSPGRVPILLPTEPTRPQSPSSDSTYNTRIEYSGGASFNVTQTGVRFAIWLLQLSVFMLHKNYFLLKRSIKLVFFMWVS